MMRDVCTDVRNASTQEVLQKSCVKPHRQEIVLFSGGGSGLVQIRRDKCGDQEQEKPLFIPT